MTDDETHLLVRDLYAVYARGDRARVAEMIDDEIDWIIYGPCRCLPLTGERAAVMSNVAFVQRSTGRTLSFRSANFLRFRNACVVEFREFADTFDVVEQALGRWLVV